RLEVNRRAVVGPLDVPFRLLLTARRPWSGSRGGGPDGRRRRLRRAEELIQRHAELADDRVQRAHGRARLARLDLRDRARRDSQTPGQLAQAQPTLLAMRP